MVFQISKLFNFKKNIAHRPLLNQIPVTSRSEASASLTSLITQKRMFWQWFRTKPELNSPVNIRVDDTIGEVEFFDPEGKPLGRNKLKEARKTWNDNFLYERLKSIQFDRLTTGDGFIWLGKLTKDQVKEVFDDVLSKNWFRGIQIKELIPDIVKAIDEDLRKPRKIDYIASSTVLIQHDNQDILGYVQQTGGHEIKFNPDEIIHIPLSRLDGKVNGFTPVSSLDREMILIWAIKENMISYFRNGGKPSMAWILKEEIANSPNHKWLVQQLMDKGSVENRHGHLVFTGDIDIKELEKDIRDMDYQKLALYVTSLVAYALRVPVSRIPFLMGQAATKGDAGGMAESGYWAMIESDQRTLEQHLNTQLFNKLGFSIKFIRHYKIDQLREAQAKNFMIDSVTKMQMELAKVNQSMTDEKIRELLDLSVNDVRQLTAEEKLNSMQSSGLLGRTTMKNGKMDEEKKQNENSAKKGAAENNPSGGIQTGF